MVEQLRRTFGELMGSERRLRGRDQQRHGDLTNAQIWALALLARAEEATAGQLAKAADVNPASMTATLDHLERDGVVQRRRGTQDRRVCFVSLTEHGRALLEDKRGRWQDLWRDQMADYSDEEPAAAVSVITSMTALLDRL